MEGNLSGWRSDLSEINLSRFVILGRVWKLGKLYVALSVLINFIFFICHAEIWKQHFSTNTFLSNELMIPRYSSKSGLKTWIMLITTVIEPKTTKRGLKSHYKVEIWHKEEDHVYLHKWRFTEAYWEPSRISTMELFW